jgi:hypothetical protein
VQRDGEGKSQPEIGSSGSSIRGIEERRKRSELRCEYEQKLNKTLIYQVHSLLIKESISLIIQAGLFSYSIFG